MQDEWKLTNAVTLNAGVRYDLQWLETIATDTNNVSPRIGVAWTPFDSRSTHRPRERRACSTIACRCARWPTR